MYQWTMIMYKNGYDRNRGAPGNAIKKLKRAGVFTAIKA
jgi:hypothetical protein